MAMEANKIEFREGDIVMLRGGRVFRVWEVYEDFYHVYWMEADEGSGFLSKDKAKEFMKKSCLEKWIENPSADQILTFNATRSIHLRLNKLKGV